MTVSIILHKKRNAIIDRWQQDALASYADNASAFFSRENNQFANPVGNALCDSTRAIFENLLDGFDADLVCRNLNEIIKMRAIQDFSPSRAVAFVFLLKKAIRAELADVDFDEQMDRELDEIDATIDQIALFAFDIYVKCREQMYELRVNEVKRSVSLLMKRFNGDDSHDASVISLSEESPKCQGGDR